MSVITEIWSLTHPKTNPCSSFRVSCPAMAFLLSLCCDICSFGLEPFLQDFAPNCIKDLLCFLLKSNNVCHRGLTVSSRWDAAHESRQKWKTNYGISAVPSGGELCPYLKQNSGTASSGFSHFCNIVQDMLSVCPY